MAAYRYLIAGQVLEAYAAADEAEQSRLLRAFEIICADPESSSHVMRTWQGREVSARWFGNWLIAYYLDYPIRTVVITDCQWT